MNVFFVQLIVNLYGFCVFIFKTERLLELAESYTAMTSK